MKKIKFIAMALMLVMMPVMLTACGKGGGDLDSKIEAQIRQDFFDQFNTQMDIFRNYGTYNNYIAFLSVGDSGAVSTVITNFKLAGTIFKYSNECSFYLWKDGHLISMADAYWQGLITDEDVAEIGRHHFEYVSSQWSAEEYELLKERYFSSEEDW